MSLPELATGDVLIDPKGREWQVHKDTSYC